ncbi:hypothetical protein C162_19569 [Paenibacillus sp. FSL R7-269]|uniref:pentapeptide repeat-containing protein n=1 Tax=Paenibacillus sp. FSL R7-269 TaxID=1226755 RepID=UPI0003E26D9F|nr:pentapeptide repeat-containing protein [Paenibacillus sp. FSL R7-269]ETT46689.1 hypothetical protein C162_19569 [Paenibacillus sp. FSL R7-269]
MKKINQTELNILIQDHNLYLNTITDQIEKGQRLILDEVDFTDNDLSDLDFVETYITSSLFKGKVFNNTNFGGAELYDCIFIDTLFENCNLGKTALDYAIITSSKFSNCNFISLETYEAQFENSSFKDCLINSAFSSCIVKDVVFEECNFVSTDFWRCVVENLKISSKKKDIDLLRLIKEINIGTFEMPNLINAESAIEYFKSKCMMDKI